MSLVVGFLFGFIGLFFCIFICGAYLIFITQSGKEFCFRLISATCGSHFPNRVVSETGCVFLLLVWLR